MSLTGSIFSKNPPFRFIPLPIRREFEKIRLFCSQNSMPTCILQVFSIVTARSARQFSYFYDFSSYASDHSQRPSGILRFPSRRA